jgi:VWFA-related protein
MTQRLAVTATCLLILGAALSASLPGLLPAPVFSLSVPDRMVTGRVLLQAQTRDTKVESVKWQIDDFSRITPPPFDLVLDLGPLPHEKTITAVALDRERRPLYRQEAVLNPGGRHLSLEILSPVQGQKVSGPVPVLVHAAAPPGDSLETLVLDVDGHAIPLAGDDEVRSAVVEIPDRAMAIAARLKTARGGTLEKTILVNGRGFVATLDAHIVEQTVGVYQGNEPLERLTIADFSVRDDRGPCEIREVKLMRDAPLSLGIAIDTSLSLLHTEELRDATANRFIALTLRLQDLAFLNRFGRSSIRVVDWTSSKEELKKNVLMLGYDSVPGTVLHEAIIRSLYQFQGSQGARALVLITDGNAYDDDVGEADAFAYAREAGVKIYALGLPWEAQIETPYRVRDENGNTVVRVHVRKEKRPANQEVLHRFSDATGGRTYLVDEASDLPKIFAKIERDLRTQYLVSYVSNATRRGAFHPVEIRTTKGKVSTAAGFFY